MNDLKKDSIFILDGNPYVVLEARHLHIGRGGSSLQTRLKNLITGNILSRNFKQSDSFEEAEVKKLKAKYLYNHRQEYWFCEEVKPANRFMLTDNQIGEKEKYLKSNLIVEAIKFDEKIININLPIKVDYRVTEAPPGIKGDTAQGGTKLVAIETGAKISTPLFINEGDIIKINTETEEYVERVEKSK